MFKYHAILIATLFAPHLMSAAENRSTPFFEFAESFAHADRRSPSGVSPQQLTFAELQAAAIAHNASLTTPIKALYLNAETGCSPSATPLHNTEDELLFYNRHELEEARKACPAPCPSPNLDYYDEGLFKTRHDLEEARRVCPAPNSSPRHNKNIELLNKKPLFDLRRAFPLHNQSNN